jgi:hypothetical protein
MRGRRVVAQQRIWSHRARVRVCAMGVVASVAFVAVPGAVAPHWASSSTPQLISRCGSDAQAAAAGNDVYVTYMGCSFGYIEVSSSTDGGRRFGSRVELPGSFSKCRTAGTCNLFAQAPMITIGPHGLVYVSFMFGIGEFADQYPVVDVSANHGRSFKELARVPVPATVTDGSAYADVDSIHVARNGTIYLVWGYGPDGSEVKFECPPGGSCAYTNGDFNIVIQRSTNGGRSWSTIDEVTPGYPLGGAVCASFVVAPDGTLDLLYNDFPTDPSTYALSPGTEYFTRSTDEGRTWSAPVVVGAGAGTESPLEWWIEGDLAIDSHGDLLATWDTQTATTDTGWLSVSTDGGSSWSTPLQATPIEATSSAASGEMLMEATAVGTGLFALAWQTKSTEGYATLARVYSLKDGFQTPPLSVSAVDGSPRVWPGDRVALAELPEGPRDGAFPAFIAWGSATGDRQASALGSIFEP